MTTYTLDKICKHSVRYEQKDKKAGTLTIYVPNEALTDGPPPDTVDFTFNKEDR